MPKKLEISNERLEAIVYKYTVLKISLRELEKQELISRKVLSNLLKDNKVKVRSTNETSRKYSHNENYFSMIDNESKAYWLGFMFADGYITSKRKHGSQSFGFTLSVRDIEHLEKFKRDIESNNPINIYDSSPTNYNTDSKFCRLLITSQKTVDDLKSLGVIENKTNNLTFPKIPENLIHHFIRGYFDGDGYVSILSSGLVFGFSGPFEFLQKIKEFFPESNASLLKDKSIFSFKIGGTKKAFYSLNKMYTNSTIYLNRKYEKYKVLYEKYSEN